MNTRFTPSIILLMLAVLALPSISVAGAHDGAPHPTASSYSPGMNGDLSGAYGLINGKRAVLKMSQKGDAAKGTLEAYLDGFLLEDHRLFLKKMRLTGSYTFNQETSRSEGKYLFVLYGRTVASHDESMDCNRTKCYPVFFALTGFRSAHGGDEVRLTTQWAAAFEFEGEAESVSGQLAAWAYFHDPVASIDITPSKLNLVFNPVSPNPHQNTGHLVATLRDNDGFVLSGRKVTWTSSNEKVAQVNDNGVVTGLSKGNAVITARSEGVTRTVSVQVTPRVVPDRYIYLEGGADRIKLVSVYDEEVAKNYPGQVEVCLQVATSSGWWKGIGISTSTTDPTIEGEKSDGIQCIKTNRSNKHVYYWKAKFLGVHTYVGADYVDMTNLGGYKVTFVWETD